MDSNNYKNEHIEIQRIKDDLRKFEKIQEKQGEAIVMLQKNIAETKILAPLILERLSSIEGNLFKLVGKEKGENNAQIFSLIKFVIGGTIIAFIAYAMG